MKDDGVLISRAWAEKVNATLFGTADASPAIARASRFYDVRPASLASSWTQNAAGVWTASACFIVRDVVDSSNAVPIYAPTAEEKPAGETGGRFFLVWRGRWEMLGGAGGGTKTPTTQTAYFLKTATTQNDEFLKTATASPTSETITHLINVTEQDGALVFTSENKQVLTGVNIETTKGEAVVSVSKTSAEAVVGIQWT